LADQSGLKIAICIPSGDSWNALTAFTLMCLGITSSKKYALLPATEIGNDPAQARNTIVRMAMGAGADYFLLVDADMVFPWDALDRLLAHNVDIVGVDYRKRKPPYETVGVYANGVIDPSWAKGLLEVEMLGLGLVLVRRRVFETLKGPWFARVWQQPATSPDNPDGFTTEDTWFFHHAKAAGFRAWCDMDLTREVSHWGQTGIPWDFKAPSA
jgi:hypothetical protein